MSADPSAGFTGERLPGGGDANFQIDMERHLAAYRYALPRAAGKSVLDAGCGEGYGAVMLAEVARRVLGVDREEPLAVARERYRAAALEFRPLDLMQLPALGERFDLVVSFQVIEHLPDPSGFLRGLADRVAPGGTLIVTTPNRLMSVSENPYHLREWTAPELLELARGAIPRARVLGVNGSAAVLEYERARGEQVRRILRLDPLGLRRLVPTAVVHFAFSRLARLVRRRVSQGGSSPRVGPADFTVGGDALEQALDLMILVEP